MEFKYTTSFSSILKPIVSEEKDKFLALASLVEIGKFIPDVDTATNTDLLPVAFNACVINRVNKNGDVIDTDTALAIYKSFINKPINIEHNRQKVIGVIVSAGFSEFGTDKPLTEEQIKGSKNPFNITLGGLVWRVVNPELSDIIEDSNDPTSPNYMGISASWELGFMDYKIVVLPEGQKNIANAEIVSDKDAIAQLKNKLKGSGGDGKTIDDKFVYRMPSESVLALGIGFTQKPAADVEGIATERIVDKAEATLDAKDAAAEEALVEKLCTKITEKALTIQEITHQYGGKIGLACSLTIEKNNNKSKNISQPTEKVVNQERTLNSMKITNIAEITDENLKEAKASDIASAIAQALTEKGKEWEAKKNELNTQISDAAASYEQLKKQHEEVVKTLGEVQATLKQMQAEKLEAEKVEKFNARMSEITEAYELDDDARAALVEEVKAIASDEDFDKFKKKAAVLLKGFAKKAPFPPKKKDGEKCEECGKEPCACEAKCKASEAKASEAVDKAVDNAKKENGLPNSSSAGKVSLKEKYQAAFAMDQFTIKK